MSEQRVHRRNTLPMTLFPEWLIGTIDSRGWYVVSTLDSSIYLRKGGILADGVGVGLPNCGFWPTCQDAVDALGEFISIDPLAFRESADHDECVYFSVPYDEFQNTIRGIKCRLESASPAAPSAE